MAETKKAPAKKKAAPKGPVELDWDGEPKSKTKLEKFLGTDVAVDPDGVVQLGGGRPVHPGDTVIKDPDGTLTVERR